MIRRAAGIDVGGTALKTVVLENGGVIRRRTVAVGDAEVLPLVESVTRGLIDELDVDCLGLGLAGLVTWPDGVFRWGPHLDGTEIPFRSLLEAGLGLPVVVDNDANLAALAEATAGAGRSHDPVLMATFGTGIGGGLVVGGEIYRGRSFAGELGHVVVMPDGDRCACGGRGCWETLVSGSVLDREARRMATSDPAGAVARLAGEDDPAGAHLAAAAEAGDPEARAVLATVGGWIGHGVAGLVSILDPGIVVLGGAMMEAGEIVLESARWRFAQALSGRDHRGSVELVVAEHGGMAGAVGAALAASRTMETGT